MHIAIDLGGKESQVCVRRSDGTISREERMKTAALEGWLATVKEPCVVVVETCAEALRTADAARALGHEIRVVPSTLCPSLLVGARGKKTDRDDARALSLASCRIDLPSVHVPSPAARDRKSELTARSALVEARKGLVNVTRSWLRTRGWTVQPGSTDTFASRVRKKAAAQQDAIPVWIERLLVSVDELTKQIAQANQEAKTAAASDPRCELMMSVPGIGSLVSLAMVSTVDDEKRFEDTQHLASYVGLVPSEDSSSQRVRRGGITKAGSARLRWLLVQAAWSAWRTRPNDPMVLWAKQVAERRGRRVAITALARKILGIAWAIWKSGKPYEPRLGASARSTLASVEEGLAMLAPT